MGFFSIILGTDLKSNSMYIVNNLLQYQVDNGFMNDNPKKVAIYLVNRIWKKTPDIFNGKFGQSPFKLTVAIYALVKGYKKYPKGPTKSAIFSSICNAFADINQNRDNYPLNSLDIKLLRKADKICNKIIKDFKKEPTYHEIKELYGNKQKRKLINEMNHFLDELKTKNNEQIAVRLAFALIIRNELISKAHSSSDILDGNIQDESKLTIINQTLLSSLKSLTIVV